MQGNLWHSGCAPSAGGERSAGREHTLKDTVRVPLSCGRQALIDAADADLILPRRWHSLPGRKTRYAFTKVKLPDGRRTSLYMHRLMMSPPLGMQVDHIDGDGLNNRRSNLRLCTQTENLRYRQKHKNNRGRFKGVRNANGIWAAFIHLDGADRWLGYFETDEDAAYAYDAAARDAFGEFARLNFPAAA